ARGGRTITKLSAEWKPLRARIVQTLSRRPAAGQANRHHGRRCARQARTAADAPDGKDRTGRAGPLVARRRSLGRRLIAPTRLVRFDRLRETRYLRCMPTTRVHRLELFLVRPTTYDDDGYLIRHLWGVLPTNTLACLHALSEDVRRRRVLGDVALRTHLCDE